MKSWTSVTFVGESLSFKCKPGSHKIDQARISRKQCYGQSIWIGRRLASTEAEASICLYRIRQSLLTF